MVRKIRQLTIFTHCTALLTAAFLLGQTERASGQYGTRDGARPIIPVVRVNYQDEEPADGDAVELPTTVVEAERPAPEPVEPEESPEIPEQGRLDSLIPQTGLDFNTFQYRSNRRAGDILQSMPGVIMGGAPGENKDVRLRGLDKEFTRTQLDGVQLPGAGEKREFQVNRLPSFMLGEVTIIRNPTAAYESDGIAGRVEMKTRDIPEELEFSYRAAYGGMDGFAGDNFNFSIGIANRPTESFGYLGAYDVQDIDFFRDKTEREFQADGSLKKSIVESEKSDQVSETAFFDLALFHGYDEFHFKPLFLEADETKSKRKLETEPGKAAKLDRESEEKDQFLTGLGFTHRRVMPLRGKSDLIWENRIGLYTTGESKDKTKLRFKESGAGSGLFTLDKTEKEDERKEDETVDGASALYLPLCSHHELGVGVAMRRRDRFRQKTKVEFSPGGSPKDKTQPKDDYSLREDYFAIFLQDRISLTERLSVLPGVRMEHVTIDSLAGDGASGASNFTDVNPSVHIRFGIRESLALHAAISRGVNRPKFDEISPFSDEKDDRIVIGNPDLSPARSWNCDVGGDYGTASTFLSMNFFYRKIRGVIEEVDTGFDDIDTGKDVFAVDNVGNGWTSGLEFEQRYSFLEGATEYPHLTGLSLWANETLLWSRLVEKATDPCSLLQRAA